MSRILGVALGVIVVVLLGVGLGLWGSRSTVVVVSPVVVQTNDPLAEALVAPPAWPTNARPVRVGQSNRVQTAAATPTNPAVLVAPATNAPNVLANWEQRIDDILASEIDDNLKARQMMQVFPLLPPEAQTEVAQHMANLTADADFPALAGYLMDPQSNEEVQDILLGDALNRPNNIKLPTLLAVASTPGHPRGEEARNILELFLEEDYGSDWNRWRTAMEQWLRDNPEQE